MDVKLLSGALGAEINGIDLKDSSINNFNLINKLLLEHKVLFFIYSLSNSVTRSSVAF